jgi:SAM-dependent methyltransferase
LGKRKRPGAGSPGLEHTEVDPEGEFTLETLSAAAGFNRWMYETIAPYIVGPVLEIGSGIGNISAHVLGGGHETYLSDLRPHYCERLRETLGQHPRCRDVLHLDLVAPHFEQTYARHLGRFGSVIALNVVEHIADDRLAIRNCCKLLHSSGRLIILVPAYKLLYNRFDRALGHFRRYSPRRLEKMFSANGLNVLDAFHFNLAGILGWFVSGSVLRQATISSRQMGWYNCLVRLFRLLDRMTFRSIGLSVVAIGQNTTSALQDVRPDELRSLDLDALQRPHFGRRQRLGALVGDEEGVATRRGAGAGDPGDGPAGVK